MNKGIVVGIVVLAVAGAAHAEILYAVTDLGTLGGALSRARGLNDYGQVVGESDNGDNEEHAFLWDNGVMTDLGVLGSGHSQAFAINNSVQIVGWTYVDSTSGDRHAFLYENGNMVDLGTLGGTDSHAFDINDAGQIVGRSNINSSTGSRGFLYQGGTMTNLGTVSGGSNSDVRAINESGKIVGFCVDRDSTTGAYSCQNGSWTDLHAIATYPHDVNDSGQVAAIRFPSAGGIDALVYDNGTWTDLGSLGGNRTVANAINNSGQIVGESSISSYRAFLYENGTMTDLNDLIDPNSGWELSHAQDINDNGQIVGWGGIGGEEHAYLLTVIPEPTTLALLLIAGLSLLRRGRSS